MEKWAKIPNFENYEASSFGRVRTIKTQHIRKTQFLTGGYEYIGLRAKGKLFNRRLHRVIWETFNGGIPKNLTVNHKDLNKKNNALINLELLSQIENDRHAKLDRYKLSKFQIEQIRTHPGGCREVGRIFNLNFSTVAKIRRREYYP